jgi:hypothetical protein
VFCLHVHAQALKALALKLLYCRMVFQWKENKEEEDNNNNNDSDTGVEATWA